MKNNTIKKITDIVAFGNGMPKINKRGYKIH